MADLPEQSLLAAREGAEQSKLVDIVVKAEFRPASRGIVADKPVRVAADDVLEIEFADGIRVWMRSDEYRERFGAPAREGSGAQLEVPGSLTVSPTGAPTRGAIGWVLKSLKVLGIDVHERSARALAERIEKRKGLRRPGPGLFRCRLDTDDFALEKTSLPEKAADDRPYLILLHGTLSSTWGSFGELWSKERARELQALKECYADRVLGFEHQTLAVSPLQNALDLLESLPAGARVHLISHSSGGLVGELLCRSRTARSGATSANAEPFSAQELALFKAETPLLAELNRALRNRELQIERFVRVACPALGTTLASGRLDRWLSLMGSVASRALPRSPIAELVGEVGEFIAAVVKERTDPKTLPGVEAMMPESSFIRLVNWPDTSVGGDLYVVAGDLAPDTWWAKLLMWVTDRFYDGDHDLVVNTASMYGGADRTGAARASFFEGPSVNHFNYFRNTDSAAVLTAAVTRGEASGFQDFEPVPVDIARAIEIRDATPRPIVFVLPGIMGSELAVRKDRIWFDLSDLVFGGIEKLAIGARDVRLLQPFARYYGELIEHLAASHRVVPFPYDWRLDPRQEADRLAASIREHLPGANAQRMPIRILAHSMGGLVARTMIARQADLWREVLAIPGARFVMLGTPNGGSHAITELLVARSRTLRQLALLDVRNSALGLLNVISRFPGVLAMLPLDAREDYFAAGTWRRYAQRAGDGWAQPRGEDLAGAREVRHLLDRASFDAHSMLYVAGHARATVCGMRLDAQAKDPEHRIQFDATNRGDGRVTWESGIPPILKTWYMNVEHGDLSADEDGFPAIVDLLGTGSTSRLATTPPVDRAAVEIFPMPRDMEAIYPDEASLQADVLGGRPPRSRRARRRAQSAVSVRAVHASLAFARFPVVVGHYAGDTIISAERALDRALGGQLSRRLQLGLYPGAIETSAVFVNARLRSYDRVTPKGALVIGLGTAGAMSASQLTRAYVQGLLGYVTEWTESGPALSADPAALGISTLLIGSGMGGVGIADSVAACLRAVARANDILEAANQPQRIAEIEFIELWRDRAIQTIGAFARIEKDEPALKGRFRFDSRLARRKGARQRASYQEPGGWWHRLQIVGEDVANSDRKALRFSAITRRARNEVRLHTAQRALVEGFVKQAIRTTQHEESLARTLFELLLPNEFKDASLDEDNVVLLLDDESASYPWELLEDPLESNTALRREPFICRHGVLRQLESLEFREHVQPSTSTEALVVGDPVSPFVELKGAQREARTVAHTLEVSGRFRVTHLDRPSGAHVLKVLFDRPYRILHLAGHGVYGFKSPGAAGRDAVTGMVIGDGMYLTPGEVRQMRHVPELVFLNCCHLGRIEAGEPDTRLNRRDDYNHIAANVAQEFIRMGVRAVVAAGWAVDDEAATIFAQTFYADMAAGMTFGTATRAARREIYERFASVNTWGAYQCYGDPDYRLVTDVESAGPPADLNFATPEVAVMEIEDIAALLETIGDQDPAWHIRELERMEQWLERQEWLSRPAVSLALARAYWEALCYEDALRFYRRALREDSASLTFRDVEQFASLLMRWAVESAKSTGKRSGRKAAEALFTSAEELLAWMTTPLIEAARESGRAGGNLQMTAERLSLLGSLQKHRAWISEELSAARQAVGKMLGYYEQALELSPPNRYYANINAIMARVVSHWMGMTSRRARETWRRRAQPRLLRELAELTERIQKSQALGPDFWADAAYIDCQLLKCMAEDALNDQAVERLGRAYLDIRSLSSRREFASVQDQVDFLRRMAAIAGEKQLAPLLERLVSRLCGNGH